MARSIWKGPFVDGYVLKKAEKAKAGASAADASQGLTVLLRDRGQDQWVFPEGARIAQRMTPLPKHTETEVCAPCHARRAPLADGYTIGQPLLDGYRPALLDPGLYHADGQIDGEVYNYGSFLQSRMYRAGVTCSNCHDGHSGKLVAEGNAVCTQCHTSDQSLITPSGRTAFKPSIRRCRRSLCLCHSKCRRYGRWHGFCAKTCC